MLKLDTHSFFRGKKIGITFMTLVFVFSFAISAGAPTSSITSHLWENDQIGKPISITAGDKDFVVVSTDQGILAKISKQDGSIIKSYNYFTDVGNSKRLFASEHCKIHKLICYN